LVWREDLSPGDDASFSAGIDWLKREQPEAILFLVAGMVDRFMRATRWRPGKVGLAAVLTNEMVGGGRYIISGCDTRRIEMWRRSGQMLKTMVGRGERGQQEMPSEQVLDPVWLEGSTLRTPS